MCAQHFVETNLRVAERHLSYGTTQCSHLPLNTRECAPPQH